MKHLLGLIGYPLAHSFSPAYFADKFNASGLTDWSYSLYPLEDITLFPALCEKHPDLKGLNVTIPYKQTIIPYLDFVDPEAALIGAVNTIVFNQDGRTGYNTDIKAAYLQLEALSKFRQMNQALVLGTGGASKAVCRALVLHGIPFKSVSRNKREGDYTYAELDNSLISEFNLIINATPLGMFPHSDTYPFIPYEGIGSAHTLFDLVYNPEITVFLAKGTARGAYGVNGLQMLHHQADLAWELWTNLNKNNL